MYGSLVDCLMVWMVVFRLTQSSRRNEAQLLASWEAETKSLRLTKAKPIAVNSTLVEWGLTIPNGTVGVPCWDGDECLDYGVAKVIVTYEADCERIAWTTTRLAELKDCVNLLGHWYGGGQQFTEPWPIEKNPRLEAPFVTGDILGHVTDYGGVSERYWISSIGVALQVYDSIPLFVSVPDADNDGRADQLCLSSKFKAPFVPPSGESPLNLSYTLCYADDVRQVHENNFFKFYAPPKGIPDERMLTAPIWSTWAEFKTEVNQSRVLELAQTILDQGFNNSQIEIDDNWESCYGEHEFNPERFPDPKGMIDTLHAMGYRVTVWIHPFINDYCASFQVADQAGFFIKNASGVTQLTSWWQGIRAGLIDFTNNEALTWFSLRLEQLKAETGVDSFKFDAGETVWIPPDYELSVNRAYWPNAYTTAYVNTVADFGSMIEVRVGYTSQNEAVFVRMMDKYSYWSNQNGLKTMVPSLLHSSIIGYPFVLPDMVGGNAYTGRPSAELFIRWAQANTFMPAIQFSLLPWEFDSENPATSQISREVVSLHAQFAPLIIELAKNASLGGGPITRPTWWLCPTDEQCLLADQQFLLGDDLLVTPVMTEGATVLDVVFPPGAWLHSETGQAYNGPQVVTLNVTIDSNVYFTKV